MRSPLHLRHITPGSQSGSQAVTGPTELSPTPPHFELHDVCRAVGSDGPFVQHLDLFHEAEFGETVKVRVFAF